MLVVVALISLSSLSGCSSFEAPPPPPEPTPCTLTSDTLAGHSFVREVRSQDATHDEEDPWARATFYKEGETLKMKYNSRSPFDMYVYTCQKGRGETICQQDTVDLQQWCQSLIANKGNCSPAELAALTGASVADATKAQEALMVKVKALSPEELDRMKRAFAQPNNQLRGIFKFKVNPTSCKLAAADTYQTMVDGKIREVENYVGNSKFIETKAELSFDHCADLQSLVALSAPGATAAPGQTKVNWTTGEHIPFAYVAATERKAEPGCTYAMSVWSEFLPVEKELAVTPGADGVLNWTFERVFDTRGKKVVQMTRSKTCAGGAPTPIDLTCALVDIEAAAAAPTP